MMIGRREGDDSQPDSRYPAHLGDHFVPEIVRQVRSSGGRDLPSWREPWLALTKGHADNAAVVRWVGTVRRPWHAGEAFMQSLGLSARLIDGSCLT